MISIQPIEYNSSFPGIEFDSFVGDEYPKRLEARYDMQATIDGEANVEVSAVTEAGKEFQYEDYRLRYEKGSQLQESNEGYVKGQGIRNRHVQHI